MPSHGSMGQESNKLISHRPTSPTLPPSPLQDTAFTLLHCASRKQVPLSRSSWQVNVLCKIKHRFIGRARYFMSPACMVQRTFLMGKTQARTINRPYLLRTSGINRETSTHFPAPRHKKCRRKQTARGCPIAAGLSPFPAGGQRLQQRRPAVLLQVLCQPRGLHANPAARGGKGGGTLANSYQAF